MKGQNLRHNVLLQQLATSFPRQHPGASTYYYDFASSFDKVPSAMAPFLWSGSP
jgi:hypothetical protein